jgi:hypothetical protein
MISLRCNYPPPTRGLAIVWGILARYPFGGVTWQALHHLVGLRRLGFDVWYVEDSDSAFSHPETHLRTYDPADNVAYLTRQLARVGLADRWSVRIPRQDEVLCPPGAPSLAKLYASADLVLNVCGAQELLPHHERIRFMAYLQTDPVAEQVRMASGDIERRDEIDRYGALFTYGENIGYADCLVPSTGHGWLPTRPPVCIDWWQTETRPRMALTTVANWRHEGNDVCWNGHVWRWSKHLEFQRILDLPRRVQLPLEIALGKATFDEEAELLGHGWTIVNSISDPEEYLSYIQHSAGELTAAKEQYVAPRSGWFSDRSACYLAAGRPVITQDTGFGSAVPTGHGLFAFSTVDEAAAAVDAIAGNYAHHSAAAQELANEYFDARRLLNAMLKQIGFQ